VPAGRRLRVLLPGHDLPPIDKGRRVGLFLLSGILRMVEVLLEQDIAVVRLAALRLDVRGAHGVIAGYHLFLRAGQVGGVGLLVHAGLWRGITGGNSVVMEEGGREEQTDRQTDRQTDGRTERGLREVSDG
jgi:hypothetical protein